MLKQKKKYFIMFTFVFSILIINFSFGFVTASDNDNDGVDDDFEELNKRKVEIEFSNNEFQIESHLRSGEIIDEISLKTKYNNDGISITFSYEEEFESENSNSNDSEFELEFGIKFHKIIEYIDIDDNSIYNSEDDSTIQSYSLDEFYPVNYSIYKISGDCDLHYFKIDTKDGIFTAHIYVTEEFTIVNDSLITPNQIKINIQITNFPYLNNNSQLALYTKLESELDFEEEEETEDEKEGYAENEQGVITSTDQFTGFFTWQENATIDGISQKVFISTIKDDEHEENEQEIYINYRRGDYIFHDPKIGIEGLLISKKPSFPLIPLIIVISVISALSISVAYSVYYFTHNRHPSKGWEDKLKFIKPASPVNIQIFEEENSINKLIELGDVNITTVSEDLFEKIKNLDMDANEKQEFLEEMLSLSPNERDSILNKILKKNIQTQ